MLYVHGWNDYFFQRHLADEVAASGIDFYALDLRRYGRSLREGQLAGFIIDLRDYFVELDRAVEILRADHDDIVLHGHSTGGLVLSLYLNARPDAASALVLNAPWLELQGSPALRPALQVMFGAVRQLSPTASLAMSDNGFYRRSISAAQDGEWDYRLDLKGDKAFAIRVGWLAAIMNGHSAISAGLAIDVPILVGISARSDFARKWSDDLLEVDTVLDVEQLASRAHRLGRHVTLVKFDGALHDLALSRPEIRDQWFAEIRRWLASYGTPSEA